MRTILSDNFETNLGIVSCYLQTDTVDDAIPRGFLKLSAAGHDIYCQNFDLQQVNSDQPIKLDSCKGWRWFIEKTNDIPEHLILFCKLMNPSKHTEWDYASGENLNAIEISNNTHLLQIGTEDESLIEQRAEAGDWMPQRYKRIDINNNFLECSDFGIKATFPMLEMGEKIYIHFLVATKSFDSAATRENARSDTSQTVEKYKSELDDKLGKYEK